MSTSNMWAKQYRSTIGTMVRAFACAVVLSGIAITPALGEDDRRGPGNQMRQENQRGPGNQVRQENRRRYKQEQAWRAERVRREQYWRERHPQRVYPPYRYPAPVYPSYSYPAPIYTPPPVVYPPYPSPGISLVFPFHFR